MRSAVGTDVSRHNFGSLGFLSAVVISLVLYSTEYRNLEIELLVYRGLLLNFIIQFPTLFHVNVLIKHKKIFFLLVEIRVIYPNNSSNLEYLKYTKYFNLVTIKTFPFYASEHSFLQCTKPCSDQLLEYVKSFISNLFQKKRLSENSKDSVLAETFYRGEKQ